MNNIKVSVSVPPGSDPIRIARQVKNLMEEQAGIPLTVYEIDPDDVPRYSYNDLIRIIDGAMEEASPKMWEIFARDYACPTCVLPWYRRLWQWVTRRV